MTTHRAIAITTPGVLEQIELPTPSPAKGEVLYEVRYVGLMPADIYQLDKGFYVNEYPAVIGVSSAGYVKAVGEGVTDLKVGDKVAAVNFPAPKNKALQDFAVLPRAVIAKLPRDYDLADAATLSDNWVSAAFTLFGTPNLALPLPSTFPPQSPPSEADQPILVHGGGSSSGQYVIQLFHIAGYTQTYATASPHNHALLKELGAKQVFDYRSPRLAEEILEATGGKKVSIVVDSIASLPSVEAYSPILGKGTRLAAWWPIKRGRSVVNTEDDLSGELLPELQRLAGEATVFMVGAMIGLLNDPVSVDFLPKLLPQMLEQGLIRPNRVRLFKESDGPLLERVKNALSLIRENKLSGEKVVIELKRG